MSARTPASWIADLPAAQRLKHFFYRLTWLRYFGPDRLTRLNDNVAMWNKLGIVAPQAGPADHADHGLPERLWVETGLAEEFIKSDPTWEQVQLAERLPHATSEEAAEMPKLSAARLVAEREEVPPPARRRILARVDELWWQSRQDSCLHHRRRPGRRAVALSLASTGLAPVVLEAQPEPQLKVANACRLASTASQKTRSSRDCGGRGLASHGNRFVWGSPEPLERHFIFGAGGMGWQLLPAIRGGAGGRGHPLGRRLAVRPSAGSGRAREEHGSQRLAVKTEKGLETYRADFVIDASGRAARLARLLGRQRTRYDQLVGMAAYLEPDPPENRQADDSRTLVEAAEEGWWYSAPLPGGRLIVAYMTDADLVAHARRAAKIAGTPSSKWRRTLGNASARAGTGPPPRRAWWERRRHGYRRLGVRAGSQPATPLSPTTR